VDDRCAHDLPQKKSTGDMNDIRKYLDSIAAYKCHYTRRDSAMKFMPSHVTLAELYKESRETMTRETREEKFSRKGIS
jgi:hypothetical protein